MTCAVRVVTQPLNGRVTIGGDKTFTYTPDANYHGDDTFTYAGIRWGHSRTRPPSPSPSSR